MMTWEVCGRKRSWLNLGYYPGICMKGLRKTMKAQDSRSPGLDLNPDLSNTKQEFLTTRSRPLVIISREKMTNNEQHMVEACLRY
jgi:hypothetical protein